MSDLGAEVIKVESKDGDDTRKWGPPYIQNEEKEPLEETSYFVSTNRGKRSIIVDLKEEQGRQVVTDLARQSDVLIENFRVHHHLLACYV